MLHREDGPAIEYANGTREWWLDGAFGAPASASDAERLERKRLSGVCT